MSTSYKSATKRDQREECRLLGYDTAVITDISEELIVTIVRVKRIGDLRTMLLLALFLAR
jgi:hypothetical protein